MRFVFDRANELCLKADGRCHNNGVYADGADDSSGCGDYEHILNVFQHTEHDRKNIFDNDHVPFLSKDIPDKISQSTLTCLSYLERNKHSDMKDELTGKEKTSLTNPSIFLSTRCFTSESSFSPPPSPPRGTDVGWCLSEALTDKTLWNVRPARCVALPPKKGVALRTS